MRTFGWCSKTTTSAAVANAAVASANAAVGLGMGHLTLKAVEARSVVTNNEFAQNMVWFGWHGTKGCQRTTREKEIDQLIVLVSFPDEPLSLSSSHGDDPNSRATYLSHRF